MSNGLLDGLVVLDLTRVLAGPYAGMLLADMGATVYKVEMPNVGDDSRAMGPFVNKQSVYFANFNRGKVGITLNLKAPEGKEIFKELVKKAKQEAEQTKVSIRNIRRNANDEAKKLKDGGAPEDEVKKLETDIQKATDDAIAKVDKIMDAKEKEIMTV